MLSLSCWLTFCFAVIADTPYSRVTTHSFFPADVVSDVPPTVVMSQAPTSLPLHPQPIVHTPPMESFFSPLSLLPSAPSSMPVPPMMNVALSAGRLYRSPGILREFRVTNPEWNLAHSYPFQSLAFGAFSQTLN